jgi:acyl-CoA synthetase (AMP-forming)/AMP-acid ligase II
VIPFRLLRAVLRTRLLPLRPRLVLPTVRALRAHGFRPSGLAAVAAIRFPDHVAVRDDDGALTYRELDERVRRLAAALQARHGVGPERALGVMCRNHRGFVEGLLAGSALGADVVLLNTEFPGPQLAQVLAHDPLGAVVHDAEFTHALQAAGQDRGLVVAGDVDVGAASDPDISRRRGRLVLLTSGTTGVPKGASRAPSFGALAGPLTTLLEVLPLRTGTSLAIAPPLFHGFGLAYLLLALVLGATLVLRRRFDPRVLLADLDAHAVGLVVAVPTMLRRILDAAEGGRVPEVEAVLSAGSPLGAELGARFTAAFGPRLYNLYGSSETGFGAIATPADLQAAPGTVGHPPLGTEVRLLGPDDAPVGVGERGRVFVRSALVFAGYSGGGGKDVVDGFVSSGDVGHRDQAGRLFIDGRADDMIVSGGENVFPLEVEEVLASHEAVEEVAVVGVDDEEFGQRLAAYVVPKGRVEVEALRAFLQQRVARYKQPRDFVFLERLPRTATGKVLKRALVAREA